MKSIKPVVQQVLCRITGYYSDGQLYRFVWQAGNVTLKRVELGSFKPGIVILGRDCYQEKLNYYPMVERREVNKLLAIDQAGNDVGQADYITQVEESQTQVNSWRWLETVPDAIRQARVIVPESFVLSQYCQDFGVIAHQFTGQKVYIAKVGQGVRSARQTPMLSTVQRFCASVGISASDEQTLSSEQLAPALLSGLVALPNKSYQAFWSGQKQAKDPRQLARLLWPATAVLGGYLLLSSAWLLWHGTSLQSELDGYQSELNDALSVQQQFAEKKQQYNLLADFSQTQTAKSGVWLVVAEIVTDARLNAVRFNEGRYALWGETERASTLLAKLAAMPQVRDAKFDTPTRKRGGDERFRISFLIDNEAIDVAGEKE